MNLSVANLLLEAPVPTLATELLYLRERVTILEEDISELQVDIFGSSALSTVTDTKCQGTET
jgi:hypothetical protein